MKDSYVTFRVFDPFGFILIGMANSEKLDELTESQLRDYFRFCLGWMSENIERIARSKRRKRMRERERSWVKGIGI
jgi:hypothetical protein